jgi:hypothetical protein
LPLLIAACLPELEEKSPVTGEKKPTLREDKEKEEKDDKVCASLRSRHAWY